METKVNYALVGAFVLALSAAFVAGVIWLSTGAQYRKSYDTYLCYLGESVSGLNPGAPVRYRGVDVGRVTRIELDQQRDGLVRLTFDIERGTLIKEDTVAVLRSQGLTGIAFIDLTGGSKESPPLKAIGGAKYPVIKSGPSLMTRLDTAVTGLIVHLDRTLDNLGALFDEKNRKDLSKIIGDLSAVSRTLAARSGSIDRSLVDTEKMLKNGARVSESLPQLVDRIGKSADAIELLARDARLTSQATRNTVESAGESLPQLQATLAELRELTASLRRVSDEIGNDPSVLLYGKARSQPGPGE